MIRYPNTEYVRLLRYGIAEAGNAKARNEQEAEYWKARKAILEVKLEKCTREDS